MTKEAVTLSALKEKWGGSVNILPGDAVVLPTEEWELWLEELGQAGITADTIRLMKTFRVIHAKAEPETHARLNRIVEGVWRGRDDTRHL